MSKTRKFRRGYRHWRVVTFAGAVGFFVALIAAGNRRRLHASADARGDRHGALVVGSLLGVSRGRRRFRVGTSGARCTARTGSSTSHSTTWSRACACSMRRTGLLVWNERYRAMYNIDPKRIWRGAAIRDLLDARIAAGTFPLDPARYEVELRAAIKEGKTFTLTVELNNGRIIAVVNQPMPGGGWVAMHEDITERASAPNANSSTPARSSTRSSRTCRLRSS